MISASLHLSTVSNRVLNQRNWLSYPATRNRSFVPILFLSYEYLPPSHCPRAFSFRPASAPPPPQHHLLFSVLQPSFVSVVSSTFPNSPNHSRLSTPTHLINLPFIYPLAVLSRPPSVFTSTLHPVSILHPSTSKSQFHLTYVPLNLSSWIRNYRRRLNPISLSASLLPPLPATIHFSKTNTQMLSQSECVFTRPYMNAQTTYVCPQILISAGILL